MRSGYENEYEFIKIFNDKFIYQLDGRYVKFLEDIYGKELDKESYVICWKLVANAKGDIVIRVGSEKKRISIKSGKNNSIHLEELSEFTNFLKTLGLDDEGIELYKDFHYGILDGGKRIGSKEYQELFPDKLKKLNYKFNNSIDLVKIFDRFLFVGVNEKIDVVDVIIYGTPVCFKYAMREDIIKYLLSYKDEFLAPHFSALVLQPWTRNLNCNEKYEYRRDYVQVKWYRLDVVFDKIGKSV